MIEESHAFRLGSMSICLVFFVLKNIRELLIYLIAWLTPEFSTNIKTSVSNVKDASEKV